MTATTERSEPLVFFGTEDFSARSLEALIANGFNVVLAVTKPDSPRGRNRQLASPLVKTIAVEHDIEVLQPDKLSDISDRLKNLDARWAVLVSYGKILPKTILDIFPGGIINLHPSLLPRYRGPSPIESAIINGDEQTGVTIMRLSAEMDAGPLYRQRTHLLNGSETKPELYNELANIGANLLVETLPDIQSGNLLPVAQIDEQATYCSILKKADGLMDPEQKTAERLEREVRAYMGFPKSRLKIGSEEVIVTSAEVTEFPDDNALIITCKDNTLLKINGLVAPSGRNISGTDFKNGYLK